MTRTLIPVPVLAVVLALVLALPASSALRCWGSICQDEYERVYLSKDVQAEGRISLSTVRGATTIPGDLVLGCSRNPVIAPGYAAGTLRFRPGATPGTMQLVVIVGTSRAEVPLGPPIQGGSC